MKLNKTANEPLCSPLITEPRFVEGEREREENKHHHHPIEATVLSLSLYFTIFSHFPELSLGFPFGGEFWFPGDVNRWRQLQQR